MNEQVTEQIVLAMQRLVALQLWHLGAIKVNLAEPFRLVSGNYSPIYVNCRQLISSAAFADLFAAAARSICEYRHVEFDVLAGGETAGIPFAAFLARAFGRPMIYVRKAAKAHGIASRIEGTLRPDARVMLVEDLITDAASKLSFISAVRECGGSVENVLVVFDRLQGGRESLQSEGIRLHSISDIEVALSVAQDAQLLEPKELESVREYLRDPGGWHNERALEYHE